MIEDQLAETIGEQFCRNCEAEKETAFINAFVEKYFQRVQDNYDIFKWVHE